MGDRAGRPYRSILGILFPVVILLAACSPAVSTPTPAAPIRVEYTSAAQPWLSELSSCSGALPFISELRAADYFSGNADLALRLGAPSSLTMPAFQIGSDDLLVVVHPQAGVGVLSLEQARQIFMGRITNWREAGGNDVPVLAWAYAPGEDVERIFEQDILGGASITSQARLATSAQEMSDSVGADPGSIGILPRRWKTGNTREALVLSSVPVLAITKLEPQGTLKDLLACLQK